MKAYEVRETTGLDGLVLNSSRADPQPAPGQILVRMRAAALNYRDQGVIKGAYGYTKIPLIPLSDGAGEVVAAGDGVMQFKPGDRVTSTFFVNWTGGRMPADASRNSLGGMVDGVLAVRAAPRDRRNQDSRQFEFRRSRDAALRGAHRVERRC
jgi:NADPH:quinone reductase-like Zn-dependent oxidoreductase